jgi:hypothetical protein
MPNIPARIHFYWTGPSLPWPYAYAVRSAAVNGDVDEVVFHHTDEIVDRAQWEFIGATPKTEARRLDSEAVLRSIPTCGPALVELHRRVQKPVARSNILRAAILWREGGVYLDLDTVTVRSLRPLLAASAFVGEEHIVRPHFVHTSGSRWLRFHATLLSTVREGLRRLPRGYRVFRQLAPLYYKAINGAVLGAEQHHPLLEQYLTAMVTLPAERQLKQFGLGTHLLQQVVADYLARPQHAGERPLVVHAPHVLYPLGPEISEHWFRRYRGVDLAEVLAPETRVVHWYGSVGTRKLEKLLTPDFVLGNATRRLYCSAVAPLL